MTLFQNLTNGFKEEFSRIYSCPYSANTTRLPEP